MESNMKKIIIVAIAFLALTAALNAERDPLSTLKLGGGVSFLDISAGGEDLPGFYDIFLGTSLGLELDWIPLKTGSFGFGLTSGVSSSIMGILQIPLELLCVFEATKDLGITLDSGYILMPPPLGAGAPLYHHASATLGIEFKGFYLRAGAAYLIDPAGALAWDEALRFRAQCGYFFFMK
jgi:hypothetical protein